MNEMSQHASAIALGNEILVSISLTPHRINNRTVENANHENYELINAFVLTIKKEAIHIPDGDSINGVGKIICHENSSSNGQYFYQILEMNGGEAVPIQYHVESLKIRDNEGSWISVYSDNFKPKKNIAF